MAWRLPGFEQMHQLRSGPTGMVVVSRDQTTGTVVAIRYVSKSVFGVSGFAERFRNEAVALVGIESRNVTQVYDYVEGPETGAIVSEFVEGMSLRSLLDRGGPLEPEAALYVMKDALLGLAEVHSAGIIHRDFRPENLLIDRGGVTKLSDVGLAAVRRNAPAPGGPDYLAPELWTGRPVTMASDVYAVGATLFECLTGRPPRANGGPLGKAGLAEDETAALVPPHLPDRVRRLLSRQLAFQLAKRARNGSAMLDELELAALGAYGQGWEDAGRSQLAYRLEVLKDAPASPSRSGKASESRSSESGGSVPRRTISRTRMLLATALAVVLVLGALAVYRGVISGGNDNDGQGAVPTFTHTPVAVIGPPMPSPVPTGLGGDKIKPDRLNSLHVTGRSRTAVSLLWNPGRDNVKIVGYILLRDGRRVGTSYAPAFTDTGLRSNTKYSFAVEAFDAAGNLSPSSALVFATTLKAPDRTPPSVPVGLHSTSRGTNSIYLAWSPSHDNTGVAGYDVFRDGKQIASVTQANFVDRKVSPGTTYIYAVRAYDTSNNATANSPGVSVTTVSNAVPNTPPSAPTGLVVTATGVSTINVSWVAAHDDFGVAEYLVYRNAVYLATVLAPATSYIDEGLASGTKYRYKVLAVDAGNLKSDFSSLASATTQTPPPPPVDPTPTPTNTDAPPPPPPSVVSINITESPISAPTCSTTVQAVVVVTGTMSVELDYTVGGNSGSQTFDFYANGPQTVFLSTGDGTVDGTASVHDPVSGLSDSKGWSAPGECVPVVVTPTPTVNPEPTDTTGGDGGSTTDSAIDGT